MELIGNLKTYMWGKLGVSSKVAQLARLNDERFEIEYGKPYAELWIGDHINGPSIVKKTGQSLAELIKNDTTLVGGLPHIPFLFKVLSVDKALSIQVHPNQEDAKRLHEEHPDIYKDANHKPEMTIALTPFIGLCGFRPKDEIHENLMKAPELVDLLGKKIIDEVQTRETGIKDCFAKLMYSNQVKISMCVQRISERFELEHRTDDIGTVFRQLQLDFPNDIGTLCLFFLNIIKLNPGQAMYLAANVIHAYLDGDCMECMSCSDNTIRAGLTPKYKDVATLLKIMDYEGTPWTSKLYLPIAHPTLKYTKLYIPPIKDYVLVEIEVPAIDPSYKIENRGFGSIFIVLEGTAMIVVHENEIHLSPGSIIFLPAITDGQVSEEFALEVNSKDNFLAYQAMYNDFDDLIKKSNDEIKK